MFDRLDVPGVMFGFACHIRHYHTTRDDLAHLNPGSLQQQGDQTLAVARAIAAVGDVEKGGRLTFVSSGPWVLRWPERTNGGIALALALTPALPLLFDSRRPWIWPAALLVLATVSLGNGARSPAFSTTHP